MGAREVFLGLPGETLQGRQRLAKGRTVSQPVPAKLSGWEPVGPMYGGGGGWGGLLCTDGRETQTGKD